MLPTSRLSLLRSLLLPFLARFAREDDGATLVEYVLLVALLAVLCVGAVALLGTSANTKLNSAAAALQ